MAHPFHHRYDGRMKKGKVPAATKTETIQAKRSDEVSTPAALKLAGYVALTVAALLMLLLSVRTISGIDIGYHLSYGERFWTEGEVVDHCPEVYTLPPLDTRADVARPAGGPGCWYDHAGAFHFPNANWLAQVIFSGVYRVGGVTGLCLLRVLLVAAILGFTLATMRRLRLPAPVMAAGLLLITLVIYTRFMLRPELCGYVVLLAQCFVWSGYVRSSENSLVRCGVPHSLTHRTMGILIALQLLLVNLHSFFLLGMALTGVFLVDHLIRLMFGAGVDSGKGRKSGGQKERASRAAIVQAVRRLTILLAAQALVAFFNPWIWRIAVLPLQTLVYLRENGIAQGPGPHPWSMIKELRQSVFTNELIPTVYSSGFVLTIVIAALGAIGAAIRRQWWCVLLVVGMTFTGWSVGRNMGLGALLAVPFALVGLSFPLRGWFASRSPAVVRGSVALLSLAVVLVAGYFAYLYTSHQWFYRERMQARIGFGVARLAVPLGATEWLDEHRPTGRVWCDFGVSSNLHFFSRPHRDVPILSNTWAYPPEALGELQSIVGSAGQRSFGPVADRYGISTVVLSALESQRMVMALARDPEWVVTAFEGPHVVFMRTTGPDADLAARLAIQPYDLDTHELIGRTESLDPLPAFPLGSTGHLLSLLGWFDGAIELLRAAVHHDPNHFTAWGNLGTALASRGSTRRAAGDANFGTDFAQAEQALMRSLAIQPKQDMMRQNLSRLRGLRSSGSQ